MNILLSGGTGFIGTELREYFLKKGHYLTVITRKPGKYEGEMAKNQSFVSWEADLVSAAADADVVINLAGEHMFGKLWTKDVKERLYNSRIDSTNKLVEAMREAGSKPGLFISSSAAGYYGDRGDTVLDESEPAGDDFLARLCADWEDAARPAEEAGIRLVLMRNGVVMEKGGGPLQYMLPVFRLGLGGPVGDGTQYFPWIHMQDLCRAVDFLIQNEELSGAFNVNTPHPVTMEELAGAVGDVLHRPVIFRAPEFLVKLVLGEASLPLLASLRTRPEKLQQAGFEFRFPFLKEALSDIL